MNDLLIMEALGVFLLVIGILNTKGNIASIHRYHRHRVSEEDVLPFGRLMGAGTICAAIGIMIFGATQYLRDKIDATLLASFGVVILVVGLVACLVLSLYAMFKYNKGIF